MESKPEKNQSEISVLDYVKAWLFGEASSKPESQTPSVASPFLPSEPTPGSEKTMPGLAWITLLASGLGLLAQSLLEPSATRSLWISLILFLGMGFMLWLALRRGEWVISRNADRPGTELEQPVPIILILASGVLALLGFGLFSDGKFTFISALIWAFSIYLLMRALWQKRSPSDVENHKSITLSGFIADRPFFIGVILVALSALFFSFFEIGSVPGEMISAQAEHFFTVLEINQGNTFLYFSRNVVGEPLGYYWAAFITRLLPGMLTFTSLKIAYAISGLVAIFYLYKLGALLFDKYTGLAAAFLLAVSFWPILQSRSALGGGFVLSLLTPALFYLFNALMRENRNDFLISCLLIGLGIMTNKVFLVMPLLALFLLIIWRSHHKQSGHNLAAGNWILVGLSIIVVTCMPLIRFILQNPDPYFAEILTRLTGQEVALQGNPLILGLENFGRALSLANWTNRSSWVDGITSRPAVDWVSAAFFLIGWIMVAFQYFKTKDWLMLALFLLYPLLVLPSAGALAFPSENPSLSRAIGAAIPVLLLAGLGAKTVLSSIYGRATRSSRWLVAATVLILAAVIISQNYNLIFKDYRETYSQSSWNTAEIGQTVKDFEEAYGSGAKVWLIGYPYWVDGRVVAIEAGQPQNDLSLTRDQIAETITFNGPKLIIFKAQDAESQAVLQSTYPSGLISVRVNENPEKNFSLFMVIP